MKKIALAILLFLSAYAGAGAETYSATYAINVHVSASRMAIHNGAYFQELSVLIEGKKYELQSESATYGILMLGDYKAKLLKDRRKTKPYDSWQEYEFLFSDNNTRRFVVIEVAE